MPIYKKIDAPFNTQILVWHILEDETVLRKGIELTNLCINRLSQMKSDVHRCGFLSVRQLLAAASYTPGALHYDDFGKPHLNDERFISITHSHQFSAIAIGDKPLGIDLEKSVLRCIKSHLGFWMCLNLHPMQQTESVPRNGASKKLLIKLWVRKGLVFYTISALQI